MTFPFLNIGRQCLNLLKPRPHLIDILNVNWKFGFVPYFQKPRLRTMRDNLTQVMSAQVEEGKIRIQPKHPIKFLIAFWKDKSSFFKKISTSIIFILLLQSWNEFQLYHTAIDDNKKSQYYPHPTLPFLALNSLSFDIFKQQTCSFLK